MTLKTMSERSEELLKAIQSASMFDLYALEEEARVRCAELKRELELVPRDKIKSLPWTERIRNAKIAEAGVFWSLVGRLIELRLQTENVASRRTN